MGYGTGAIMAVPGARRARLRVRREVRPADRPHRRSRPRADAGRRAASSATASRSTRANERISLDGLHVADAKARIIDLPRGARGSARARSATASATGSSAASATGASRSRSCFDEDGRRVCRPDDELPLTLPDVPDYSPKTFDPDDAQRSPEPPLSRVPEWVEVELDLGDGRGLRKFRRETNTMPKWAGSCWYYLRYLDPANHDALRRPGQRGATGWAATTPRSRAPRAGRATRAASTSTSAASSTRCCTCSTRASGTRSSSTSGTCRSEEPFRKYFSQGYIQAYAYTDSRGQYVTASEVEEHPGGHGEEPTFTWQGQPVNREYGKIGKSLKNSVSPDEMYDAYGADTFRVYEMSMGPLELSKPWEIRARRRQPALPAAAVAQRRRRDDRRGAGRRRGPVDQALTTQLHQTIAGVRDDFEGLRFNTAIAKLIELNNAVTKLDAPPREVVEAMVLMLAPVAPHIAEEMWQRLGHEGGVTYAAVPREPIPRRSSQEQVTCVIQIKGKVRDRVEVPAGHLRGRPARARAGPRQGEGGDRERHPDGHRAGAEARQRRTPVTRC